MDDSRAVAISLNMPKMSPWLWRLFGRYARFYLGRSFHAIRLSRSSYAPTSLETAAVVFLNHPSWWDPLVGLYIAERLMPERQHYAPIDAEALARYPFFKRLGFFGVKPGARRGAAAFLRVSQAILSRPQRVLWVTPEGTFTDPRQRPVRFLPGLGALAEQLNGVVFIPLALEYVFWQERFPEVLARFGEPALMPPAGAWTRETCAERLARSLEAAQDALAQEAILRDPDAFEVLLRGRAGIGGVYDAWRALRARWRGETFQRAHGVENR